MTGFRRSEQARILTGRMKNKLDGPKDRAKKIINGAWLEEKREMRFQNLEGLHL